MLQQVAEHGACHHRIWDWQRVFLIGIHFVRFPIPKDYAAEVMMGWLGGWYMNYFFIGFQLVPLWLAILMLTLESLLLFWLQRASFRGCSKCLKHLFLRCSRTSKNSWASDFVFNLPRLSLSNLGKDEASVSVSPAFPVQRPKEIPRKLTTELIQVFLYTTYFFHVR